VNRKDGHIEDKNKFLTPGEVAEILRVNVLTVYSYLRKDNLNAVHLGRNYRISYKDLTAFIKSKRTKGQFTVKNNPGK
jgi:excisionase family DNA binding protein